MCGICCVLGEFSHINEQEDEITKMISVLNHRGPDGWGVYLSPKVAFGHTRLSIVDLKDGHQPMATERYIITYNGEVYNYIELRQEMFNQGISFKTQSDTEVILRLFELEGTNAFEKLNGQFAFLIWDKVDHTLTAVRDRYGMRPLYFVEWNCKIYFSSEMKSFDNLPNYERSFDPQMLLEHSLLWNTLYDNTVYKGIHSLQSGTYTIFQHGQSVRKHRYYEIGNNYNRRYSLGFEAAKEEFTALLQDSVNLRLRSHVPVGAYLSGGIDSTVIASLVQQRKIDELETFSVAFDDEVYDESVYQKEVVQNIESKHVMVQVSMESLEESFFDAIYQTERPIFRTAPVPLYLLSKRVNESNIKVVLTGEGADEFLFGYDSFKELVILEKWSKGHNSKEIARYIRQLYPHLSHYSNPKHFGLMKMYYEGFLNAYNNDLVGLNIRVNNNKVITRYLNKDLGVKFDQNQLMERVQQQLPSQFSDWSLLQKNSYWEIRTLLQGYLLSSQGDRMALSHSVESRYPFLDHRVVDSAFHYPDDFKLNRFCQKHLLKEAFRGQIPLSILERPKRPYNAPGLISFFKEGKLTNRAQEFLNPSKIEEYGLFNSQLVNRFIKKFERNIPEEIGYRDNMIITFILSTQMAKYWTKNPKKIFLDKNIRKVRIVDYPEKN